MVPAGGLKVQVVDVRFCFESFVVRGDIWDSGAQGFRVQVSRRSSLKPLVLSGLEFRIWGSDTNWKPDLGPFGLCFSFFAPLAIPGADQSLGIWLWISQLNATACT